MSHDERRSSLTLFEERQLFEALVEDLLESGCEGRYVLVKEGRVEGLFDTERAAYEAGLDRYGMNAFLVDLVARPNAWRKAPWFQGRRS